jgi:hypothetical protein
VDSERDLCMDTEIFRVLERADPVAEMVCILPEGHDGPCQHEMFNTANPEDQED